MNTRDLLLLIFLSITVTFPCCADSSAMSPDTQAAINSVEHMIKQSEDTQEDDSDLVGVTLEGTLQAAVINGLKYATGYYLLDASMKRTSRKLVRIDRKLEWRINCALLRPLRDFEKKRIKALSSDRDIEHGIIILEALKPTKYNIHLFSALAAQYAGATLAYGALRAATKELTDCDAAPIVQDSLEAITRQTIGYYVAPASPNIKLFSQNQIASYVATDLTVAASMYAYKEMTGKKLSCPKLPIPAALRGTYINEKNIGTGIYYGTKYILRTLVMDKLCGVPA
ncbi:MAG: hypothetical protein ACHQVS_00850 [Candidatus Babeliales bacterium]